MVSYRYDALGRRVQKTVNGDSSTFVLSGAQVIEERDSNGDLLREFIYGSFVDETLAMIADEQSYYYHARLSPSGDSNDGFLDPLPPVRWPDDSDAARELWPDMFRPDTLPPARTEDSDALRQLEAGTRGVGPSGGRLQPTSLGYC